MYNTVNVHYNYITNILSVLPWYKRIVREKERGRERERERERERDAEITIRVNE